MTASTGLPGTDPRAAYRRGRLRDAKALEFLTRRGCASALEIGRAAVKSKAWAASPGQWSAVERIGLAIAARLTRRSLIRPTRSNQFEISRKRDPRALSAGVTDQPIIMEGQ